MHQCTIYENSLTLQQSIKASKTRRYLKNDKVDSPINTTAGVNIVYINRRCKLLNKCSTVVKPICYWKHFIGACLVA